MKNDQAEASYITKDSTSEDTTQALTVVQNSGLEIPDMTMEEANQCILEINVGVSNLRMKVYDLYLRKGWKTKGYKDWTSCVRNEFKQAERYIFYQQKAAEIEQAITNCTIDQLGKIPEAQLRPLAKLEGPDQWREAWQKAEETAPGDKVTAKHVKAVVKEMRPPKDVTPKLAAKPDTATSASALVKETLPPGEVTPEPEPGPAAGIYDAFDYAEKAITALKMISLKDPELEKAFKKVRKHMDDIMEIKAKKIKRCGDPAVDPDHGHNEHIKAPGLNEDSNQIEQYRQQDRDG